MGKPVIWVVVPFSRPDMADNVMENYHRQEYTDKRLLIVENGDGIGAWKDEYDSIHLSPKHQSHAKNRAIEWLKKHHPNDYWCCMDDDDYYGKGYVAEHAARAKRGRINGKRNAWIEFDRGIVYFGNHWSPYTETESMVGGTMGSYVADAQQFPIIPAAEEFGFCDAARTAGLEVLTTSSQHFCYNRLGNPRDHTFQAREEKLWRYSGSTGIRYEGTKEDAVNGHAPEGNPVRYGESNV